MIRVPLHALKCVDLYFRICLASFHPYQMIKG